MIAALRYAALGYLVGAVSLPQIAAWYYRSDLRRSGTGTVGASNLSAVAPPPVVAAVGTAQILQGALPPWLARRAGQPGGVQALAGLAGVVGQDWNVCFGLRGGRGLTHSIGVLLALAPETLPSLAALGVAGLASGQVPLGMLAGFATAPLIAASAGQPQAVVAATAGLVAIAVAKRLEANGEPLPADQPRAVTLLRRLLFDRDRPGRGAWIERGGNRLGLSSARGPL